MLWIGLLAGISLWHLTMSPIKGEQHGIASSSDPPQPIVAPTPQWAKVGQYFLKIVEPGNDHEGEYYGFEHPLPESEDVPPFYGNPICTKERPPQAYDVYFVNPRKDIILIRFGHYVLTHGLHWEHVTEGDAASNPEYKWILTYLNGHVSIQKYKKTIIPHQTEYLSLSDSCKATLNHEKFQWILADASDGPKPAYEVVHCEEEEKDDESSSSNEEIVITVKSTEETPAPKSQSRSVPLDAKPAVQKPVPVHESIPVKKAEPVDQTAPAKQPVVFTKSVDKRTVVKNNNYVEVIIVDKDAWKKHGSKSKCEQPMHKCIILECSGEKCIEKKDHYKRHAHDKVHHSRELGHYNNLERVHEEIVFESSDYPEHPHHNNHRRHHHHNDKSHRVRHRPHHKLSKPGKTGTVIDIEEHPSHNGQQHPKPHKFQRKAHRHKHPKHEKIVNGIEELSENHKPLDKPKHHHKNHHGHHKHHHHHEDHRGRREPSHKGIVIDIEQDPKHYGHHHYTPQHHRHHDKHHKHKYEKKDEDAIIIFVVSDAYEKKNAIIPCDESTTGCKRGRVCIGVDGLKKCKGDRHPFYTGYDDYEFEEVKNQNLTKKKRHGNFNEFRSVVNNGNIITIIVVDIDAYEKGVIVPCKSEDKGKCKPLIAHKKRHHHE